MDGEKEARAAIVAAGRRLYQRHILASLEGNISVRLSDDRLVTTPTGANKGCMSEETLVVTDLEGKPEGAGKPSSEVFMHVAIYRARDDVGAIVHAHPPVATGYAVAGKQLPPAVLAEVVTSFGCVPIAPYGTPSTGALAEAVAGPIRAYDALLMANHGAVTVGTDLQQAEERMYQLEHFAQVSLVSHLLGGPKEFSIEEVDRLSKLRESGGSGPVPPACYPIGAHSETITLTGEELVELIADAVRSLK